jgi:DNA-binding NtrC family response regulator
LVTAALQHPIVLVDDEKSYTDLMSQMIEDTLDRRVVSFTRPLDALSALATLRPAVIVTDYYMPQISGLEFIRLASAVVPNSVFILISGHNLDAVDDQLARLPQLKAFLAKPFSFRVLAEEILRVWPDALVSPSQRADATSV